MQATAKIKTKIRSQNRDTKTYHQNLFSQETQLISPIGSKMIKQRKTAIANYKFKLKNNKTIRMPKHSMTTFRKELKLLRVYSQLEKKSFINVNKF